jgi:hypothetical protein
VEACRRSGEITVAAWLRPAHFRQVEDSRILSLAAGPLNWNFALWQNDAGANPGVYSFRLRTNARGVGSGHGVLRSPGQTSKVRLMHLVFTRSADGMARMYVDGREVAAKRIEGDFASWHRDGRLLLAQEAAADSGKAGYPWIGQFHALAIYDRALTAEEVAEHFRDGIE